MGPQQCAFIFFNCSSFNSFNRPPLVEAKSKKIDKLCNGIIDQIILVFRLASFFCWLKAGDAGREDVNTMLPGLEVLCQKHLCVSNRGTP